MHPPRQGLVVEQLTPVRRHAGFEELAGVSAGRPVTVTLTDEGLFPDDVRAQAFGEALRRAQKLQHPLVASPEAVEATGPRRWAVLWPRTGGPTLEAVLTERGVLLPDEAVLVTQAVAQALEALHRAGLAHGGVRPEWVLLPGLPGSLEARLTGAVVAGAQAWAEGRAPAPHDDLRALGRLLHQLLTGALPQGQPATLPPLAVHLAPVLTATLVDDAPSRIKTVAEFSKALTTANRTRVSGGAVTRSGELPQVVGLRRLGPWQLEELLGEGAMGQVFLARHTVLGRQAAIKVLRPEQYQRDDLVQRFIQEAQSVNQINHEHIVEVSDFGEERGPDGARTAVYFVMELLQGETLTERLARRGLSVERALHVVRQLCGALAAAHRLGVVHRDVKADNVFLISRRGDDAYVKVLDFGVAKLTQPTFGASTVSTMDGAIIGTPTNMSPEQASGLAVDHRADVYAVGVLLYQLLAGRLPLDAENFGKLVAKLLTEAPPPLPGKTPGGEAIEPGLAAVVMRCLEKDPAKRPQSMEALLALLAAPGGAVAPSRRGLWAGVAALLAVAGAAVFLRPAPTGAPAVEVPRPVPPPVVDAGAVEEAPVDAGAESATEDAGSEAGSDAGAAAEGAVDAGPGEAKRPPAPKKPVKLTAEVARRAINAGMPAVRACIGRHRAVLPGEAGSIPVQWTVEPSGEVTHLEVHDASLKGTPLEACLLKAVERFPFPPHLGPARSMRLPFTYQSTQ